MQYKKFLISCITLCLAIATCWGQKKVVFSGSVSDSTTRAPLEYATIMLYDSLQNLQYVAMSDSNGRFVIQNVHSQSYLISIDFAGCPTYKENIMVKSNEGYFYYRAMLNASQMLDAVVVRSSQPNFQMLVDRTIFRPDTAHLRNCTSGLDVLDKVPGVRVSTADDGVSLYGNANVLVLIDGEYYHRPLSSISPKDIERIEIIKNPTAQFSSEVKNVINIILKEERKQGVSFRIDGLASYPNHLIRTGLQFEYEFSKFRLYADFRFRNIQFDSHDSTIYRNENAAIPTSDVILNYPGKSKLRSYSVQYGIDYNINKNNILRFSGDYTNLNLLTTSIINGHFCEGDRLMYRKTGNEAVVTVNSQQNYSLFYKHKFSRAGHELKINTNFFILERKEKSESRTTFIFPDESSSLNTIQDTTDIQMRNANLLVDYTLPINNKLKLFLGAHEYFRHIDNTYRGDLIAYSMTYNELRSAAYLQLEYSPTEKLVLSAGLRVENNRNRLYETLRNNYWHWLPSFSLLYSPKADHQLRLSYRERLNYPNYRYLDPFVRYRTDSLTRSEGNPFLKPEHIRAIELEYSYTSDAILLQVCPYVKFYSNQIQLAHFLSDNNVLVERYQNIGRSNYYGVSAELETEFCDWFVPSLFTDLHYTHFPNPAYNGWTWDFQLDLNFYLPLDFEIYAAFTYTTKDYRYDGWEREGALLDEISITKDFFHSALQITLAVCDLIPDHLTTYYHNADYQMETHSNLFSPYAFLKIAYRFAKGKKLKRVQRDLIQEKENEL